jgi:hypothetical protein
MGEENKIALANIKIMRFFNKLFSVIVIFISLSGIAFADSTGIVFDWQPFIVYDYLKLNHPMENILPKKLLVSEIILGKFNNVEELLPSDLKTINNSSDVTAKKSAFDKIKVTFSAGNSFMLPPDEIYLRGKEGKLSRAASILPSLLRDPSQETAVETLKLIEPQVNLGFEF